jgi:hypothetical protein
VAQERDRRSFFNVVVAEGQAIFKLLSDVDELLMVRFDSEFILDLAFDIVDCVEWFSVNANVCE